MVTAAQRSWVDHGPESHFPIQNVPFGVFSCKRGGPRCGTAIGDFAVDLAALADAGLLSGLPFDARDVFHRPALNGLMALPRPAWRAVRQRLQELLVAGGDDALRLNPGLRERALCPLNQVTMHLPAQIGDYTDFYSSREHATNVGIMFRGADNALQPNWLHLPVGYHGRASSVVVSGTPVVRPRGQLQSDNDDPSKGSVYGPSRLLDIELEMAIFVGGPCPPLGRPLTMEEAEDRIFGMVVMNDWSARDIQKWEYVPLGPFGSKNFATTISPWVVTLDALEPFRCETSAGRQTDPEPLPYLRDPEYSSYDVKLEVDLTPRSTDPDSHSVTTTIARSNFRHLYWTIRQQLVHHAVTGCNMRPGDLLGSGTISGKDKGSFGSMLELTWRGRDEIKLDDGGVRKFLADYDSINLRGFCVSPDGQFRIGFGDCEGQVLPAGSYDSKSSETAAPPALAIRDLALHSYWRSSCSWRVRIALAHYGLDFRTEPVHLVKNGGEQVAEEYTAVNPMAQVPTLRFTDPEGRQQKVTQSLAIIEFLDSVCRLSGSGVPSLVPQANSPEGALRRARALEIAEVVNSGIQPLQNLATMKAVKAATVGSEEVDGRGFATAAVRRGLAACERLVAASGSTRFAVGDEVSVADLCLVPQLYNARRFKVDLTEFPHLLRVEAACAALPSFQAAHPDRQPDAEAA